MAKKKQTAEDAQKIYDCAHCAGSVKVKKEMPYDGIGGKKMKRVLVWCDKCNKHSTLMREQ